MRELSQQDLVLVFGSGDPNSKLVSDLGSNMAWGAAFGVRGGPVGMAAGATAGVLQTIGQGVYNHGPVHVPVPVLMGPSWNGSGKTITHRKILMVGNKFRCHYNQKYF